MILLYIKLSFDFNLLFQFIPIYSACDGWTNSANESIWNFLIHTSNHKEYLWCLKNLSSEKHTGEFLAKTIEEIIVKIGPENFSAIVSDSGANIRKAREIITEKYKNIINVRCMAHAINLISKDICSTTFANRILTKCNTIITYFKRSHQGGKVKFYLYNFLFNFLIKISFIIKELH